MRDSLAANTPSRIAGFGDRSWTTKYNDKIAAKFEAILTDEQKAKWKKLTGDPVPNLPANLVRPSFGGRFDIAGGLGG